MAVTKSALIKAVKAYKSDYESFRFRMVQQLKPKQISNAIKQFARGVRESEVIALWDDTLLQNGKKGFLLTEKSLYFSKEYYVWGDKSKGMVRIDDLAGVKKERYQNTYRSVGIVHRNGETEWIYTSIQQDSLYDFLAKVLAFSCEDDKASGTPEQDALLVDAITPIGQDDVPADTVIPTVPEIPDFAVTAAPPVPPMRTDRPPETALSGPVPCTTTPLPPVGTEDDGTV